ncbi:hypothetical protein SAMN05443549_11122 [Flavobacterium fluvii]|uniref:Uncharacterized protein n=1 Tax=Flavobacterium fluvii TaxID=468056 RepID=A0A1M5PLJ6_9FLAO|nr:hypothetical protein [Flavobacterium fluvii]SHH02399.1 hypothetical protein SAMN05443549_11122 [Flavobacterium fluvii]
MKKITTFWNWFQKNEQEIFHAFHLNIKKEEVTAQLLKKLNMVSKSIGFIIKDSSEFDDKLIIIFTGNGLRRLFGKMMAFENQAPMLEHFTAESFIKPLVDTAMYKDGTDEPCVYKNFEIKISKVQIALLDYNIATKQLKIDLYLPDFNILKQYDDLESTIEYIVMQIIGEIAFRKHIREINLHQMSLEQKGLLSLIELPDFIEYLYKINSRKKTMLI